MIPKKDIKKLLINKLEPVTWNNTTVHNFGLNSDIQKTLIDATNKAVIQAAPIAKYFRGGNDRESLLKIHTFIRQNLGYRKDPKGKQQIKYPNRFLTESGDCKSNALFVYAIAKNLEIPIDLRFANYSKLKGKVPTHVYNIAWDRQNKKYIFIDGTSNIFGIEKKIPNFVKNANLMLIQTLSDNMGIAGKGKLKAKVQKAKANVKAKVKVAKANIKQAAKAVKSFKPVKKAALSAPRIAFLAITRLNFRGIATKLKPKLSDKGLQDKWKNLGGDINSLKKAVNAGANKKPVLGINDEIGSLVVAGGTAAAAAPIITSLSKWLGKLDNVAQKVKAAQKAPAVQKTTAFLAKNKTLAKKIDKLKGAAKARVINEVAQRTGQTPQDVKDIFEEGKAAVNPDTDTNITPDEKPKNNKVLLIGGGVAVAAVALILSQQKKSKRK
jgi:hypothetical protein